MLLFQNFFLAIIGIALLIWGAEKFVFYSSNLAKRFGISDLLIGLTLIALKDVVNQSSDFADFKTRVAAL